MNILIPHSWLLEHVETSVSPEEIQKYVSLCGPSIERIYDREGEPVYDIEVTTNRVDSMSVHGVAREVAVILQQFGKKAHLKPLQISQIGEGAGLPLPTIIDDNKLSKRIMCVVLKNVKRAATPDWMAKRLLQTEMNVHDAVIDITNYVTHELGHPCHAFDYDKIMELGGMIIIKEAKKGQKFITLDGTEYTTVGGEVVFENDKGEIIDLPSIKGTANSSINQSTENILFLTDDVEPKKVRFASMTHAIRTTAAQLLEKNVDPHLAEFVLNKGVELFQELCEAEVASPVYDSFPGKKKPATVTVPLTRIQDYLGVELPVNTIAKILEDLGCEVEMKAQKLQVTPPTFRSDIQIPADVIEEVARIYGYHNLPSVVMPTAIPLNKPEGTNFAIENRIKRFLASIGWQEVYTYSMVSEEVALQSGYPLSEHLKLQNPLTDDRVYLRRSLVPSLEEVITNNSQRKELSVFEFANVYPPQKGTLPDETLHLTMVSTRDYRLVKGELEALLENFFVTEYEVKTEQKVPAGQQRAQLFAATPKGKLIQVGHIGVLENGHVMIDLLVRELLQVVHTHPTYQPLPKTSVLTEDMTFTLQTETEVGPFMKSLKSTSQLITAIELKDRFQQNFTFSLTFYDPQRNLSAEDVAPLRRELAEKAAREWQSELVGKLS